MFRWWSAVFARLRGREADSGWVEPSNTITKTILSGYVPELPMAVPDRAPAEVTELPQRTQPVVTRTAQRTRRRRAHRAA